MYSLARAPRAIFFQMPKNQLENNTWRNYFWEVGCFLGRAIYPKKAADMLVKPSFWTPQKCQPRGQEALEKTPPYNPIHKMYSEACAHNAM